MNSTTIVGRLGAEPELKYTQNGTPILKLRVAVNLRAKVDGEWGDVTNWYSVDCFGKRYEGLARILSKGREVSARGSLLVREYERRDGGKGYSLDLKADDVQPVGPRQDGGQRQQSGGYGNQRPAQGGGFDAPPPNGEDDYGGAFGDDDVPFAKYDGRLA